MLNQNKTTNRRIVLASRPHGKPVPDNFRLETADIPRPGDNQLLLRTVYLSLDPYMRGRMNDAPSYAPSVNLNEVMVAGTVSRVESSRAEGFRPGDWVLNSGGWQDYALADAKDVKKLQGEMLAHPSWALGLLGMPGFTGYMGLMDIGQPARGETLVVAAASGAVGSVVGQVAKLKGCRVVGVAGGPEKCRYVREELGFDSCIDHHAADFAEQLASACPDGIDIYFENVGGKVFDAVLPLLNTRARIPLCGLIANYNMKDLPEGRDRLPLLTGLLLRKRIRMQGYIISQDYPHRYQEFIDAMEPWVSQDSIRLREDRVDGLENAPQAFMGLLEGRNFGKLVVRVGEDTL